MVLIVTSAQEEKKDQLIIQECENKLCIDDINTYTCVGDYDTPLLLCTRTLTYT